MSGTFDYNDGRAIDPHAGRILVFLGKKGSGKSIMAMSFAMNYPYDLVVIDVAGDDGPEGPDVVTFSGTLADGTIPTTWPEHRRLFDDHGRPIRMILRFIPDPGSKTFLEDCDAVVGLAMKHGEKTQRAAGGRGGCGLLVHEIGVIAPANQTQPNMRRFLMANRHAGVTGFLCGPRSMAMDTLILAQADLVYTFEMKGVRDRQRIAESVGWNVVEFHEAVLELGPHEYLRYDNNEQAPARGGTDFRLLAFDPLPMEQVARVQAWKTGQRPERITKAVLVS